MDSFVSTAFDSSSVHLHQLLIPINHMRVYGSSDFKRICLDVNAYPLQWSKNGHDGVSNHQHHDCFLNRLFRRRPKKISKLRVTSLCEGKSPGTGEFPAQRTSGAENVSIWWRHHGMSYVCFCMQHYDNKVFFYFLIFYFLIIHLMCLHGSGLQSVNKLLNSYKNGDFLILRPCQHPFHYYLNDR